jgi:hypothetical protein
MLEERGMERAHSGKTVANLSVANGTVAFLHRLLVARLVAHYKPDANLLRNRATPQEGPAHGILLIGYVSFFQIKLNAETLAVPGTAQLTVAISMNHPAPLLAARG